MPVRLRARFKIHGFRSKSVDERPASEPGFTVKDLSSAQSRALPDLTRIISRVDVFDAAGTGVLDL